MWARFTGIMLVFPTRVGVNRVLEKQLAGLTAFSPPAWG